MHARYASTVIAMNYRVHRRPDSYRIGFQEAFKGFSESDPPFASDP